MKPLNLKPRLLKDCPFSLCQGECEENIPASYPVRRVLCGMMRAVDNSTGLIVDTYKKLGIWDDTLVILSADSTSLLGCRILLSLPEVLGSKRSIRIILISSPRLRGPNPPPLSPWLDGGNPDTGGSNWPLRGQKATTFEGGMRGLGFVSGAGVDPSLAGSVSNEMYHVSDWLPTIAGGIAGLSLTNLSKPGQAPPPPLGTYVGLITCPHHLQTE
jgi:arylsulfatase A-like enzyme